MSNGTLFYTDGKSVFKVQKAIVILEDCATGETVNADCRDGGKLNGFEPVELKTPAAAPQTGVRRGRKAGVSQGEQKHRSGSKSQYAGVSPTGSKFRAQLYYNGTVNHIGTFDSEIDAAKAVDAERVKHGMQKKNFP
ncbi:MAG: hypothetical protein JW947_08365 [Sedimentisphaerales bacterium]|nr:hypothetical protein [Sedimentisphaerales bacterium]